jgi:hypothetical protein
MSSVSSSNSTYPIPNDENTNLTSNPGNPASNLSWQSALWALVAIALNTMTQSSAYSHSLFSDPFSLLRASPILCLADLLVTLVWLLKLSVFSRTRIPFLEAVRYFQKDNDLDKKEERVSVLTVVLFILGPFPQFIKLNACSGIFWTLTWSWIYMLCYVVTAVTIMAGGAEEHDESVIRTGTRLRDETKELLATISEVILGAAWITQVIFTLWLIKTSLFTHAIHVFVARSFVISLFVFYFLLVIPGFIYMVLKFCLLLCCCHWEVGMWFDVIFGLGYVRFWYYVWRAHRDAVWQTFILDGTPDPFTVWSTLIWLLSLVIWPLVAYQLLYFLSGRMGSNLEISLRRIPDRETTTSSEPKSGPDQSTNAVIQLLFAIGMLGLGLGYYWQVYNPADTNKPGWVDVFG